MLHKISESEELDVDEAALRIIASKSEGSARDAVSILDQIVSYSYEQQEKSKITLSQVVDALGVTDILTILKFVQLIVANSPKKALDLLGEIYFRSNGLRPFLQDMSDFIAELTKYKAINSYNNPIYADHITEITDFLLGVSLSRLTSLWQIFNNGEVELKNAHNELLFAEMLVIKAVYACNLPEIEDIVDVEREIVDNNLRAASNQQEDIYQFMRYCHSNKAMEIYYFLMNDAEIEQCSDGILSIKVTGGFNISEQVKKMLNSWSGKEWQVKQSKAKKIVSIKDTMLEKARQSEDYNLIKKYFPQADISDILLKNN